VCRFVKVRYARVFIGLYTYILILESFRLECANVFFLLFCLVQQSIWDDRTKSTKELINDYRRRLSLRTATKLCWDTHDTGHLPSFLDGGIHLDLADLDLGFASLRRLLDLFRGLLHFRLHRLHNFHVRHRARYLARSNDRLNFL